MCRKITIYLFAILFIACTSAPERFATDNSFLDSLSHRTFNFFWNNADSLTGDRKSTRLNSSHQIISYAVFCLKKKKTYHSATRGGCTKRRRHYILCRWRSTWHPRALLATRLVQTSRPVPARRTLCTPSSGAH